ncbi:hypothetical protein FJZ26_00020 [Candidatus Parvarchaeota archaeon]|nr:hypothetical protein [Candidatus Parvarchaeota archaeon]
MLVKKSGSVLHQLTSYLAGQRSIFSATSSMAAVSRVICLFILLVFFLIGSAYSTSLSVCVQSLGTGDFTLSQDIVFSDSQAGSTWTGCFQFGQDNVDFDCSGHSISSYATSYDKYAFNITGRNNITIRNCVIHGDFQSSGFEIHAGSTNIRINNTTVSNAAGLPTGIHIDKSSNVNISGFKSDSTVAVAAIKVEDSSNVLVSNFNIAPGSGTGIKVVSNNTKIYLGNFSCSAACKPITFADGASNNVIANVTSRTGAIAQGVINFEGLAHFYNDVITNSTLTSTDKDNELINFYYTSCSYQIYHNISIYNNILNASNSIRYPCNSRLYVNLNASNTSGTNIVGGPVLGGNAWVAPLGNGFSQNCTDNDENGFIDDDPSSFCPVPYIQDFDSSNELAAGDSLPLSFSTPITSCPTTVTSQSTYKLTQNLTSSGSCLTLIQDQNIQLDCKGYSIRGSGTGTGISIGSSQSIVRNCKVLNFSTGLAISNADSVKIYNSSINNNTYGITYSNSDSSTIYNSIVSNNSKLGISLGSSTGNLFYNNIFNNTKNVYVLNSSANSWNTSMTLATNIRAGPYTGGNFWANPAKTGFSQVCDDSDKDGLCSTNYTINGTVNDDALPLSGINFVYSCINITEPGSYLLMNNISSPSATCIRVLSSNITFDCNNFAINGSGAANTYGLFINRSNFTTIQRCEVYNFDSGVFYTYSYNNTLSNLTLRNNTQFGLFFNNSHNSTISVGSLDGNAKSGLFLNFSYNNSISNLSITNNNLSGINLTASANNTFFNNFLNNTNNAIFFNLPNNNRWNTTFNATDKRNIVGGFAIGGNFWANPSGFGFSENTSTCTDTNVDNICDSTYNITTGTLNNTDYLPLASANSVISSCSNLSYPGIYTINAALQVASSTCINVTANQVEIRCTGKSINGTSQSGTIGISVNGSNVQIRDCDIRGLNQGIRLSGVSGAIITNSNFTNNSYSGLVVTSSTYVSVSNVIAKNNSNFGIFVNASSNNQFTYINTTNNSRAIGFYVLASSNNSVSNLTSNLNSIGLLINQSNRTYVSNLTSNSSVAYAVYLHTSNVSNFTNLVLNSNTYGILLNSSYSANFSEATLLNNGNGIRIDLSGSNRFTILTLLGSSAVGLNISNVPTSQKNAFSNNYFNNTVNFNITDLQNSTIWNITKAGKLNFRNGPFLGGNYWGTPSGTGYSDTCADISPADGICDSAYNLTSNKGFNIDSLPLSSAIYLGSCTNLTNPITYSLSSNISIANSTCISIKSNNARLNCLGFRISGNSLANTSGINVSGYNNTVIGNCTVSGFDFGLILERSRNNTISNITSVSSTYGVYLNYSSGNLLSGINASSNLDSGVYLIGSANNTLTRSFASSNPYGIYSSASSSNNFSELNLDSNDLYGLLMFLSNSNQIINSNFTSNSAGLFIDSSNYNLVNRTNFILNVFGLYLTKAHFNKIENTTLASSSHSGLYVYASQSNNISKNNISNSTIAGINFEDEEGTQTTNNLIYDNILNNSANVFFTLSSSTNYWNVTLRSGTNAIGGSMIGGNFWASPNGTGFSQNRSACADNDNGICDFNYTISDPISIDYLPLSDTKILTTCNANLVGSAYYSLTQNIANNSNANCFVFSSNYTELNCNGKTIDAAASSAAAVGVSITTKKNITIRNCIISEYPIGIRARTASTNITIINSTVYSSTYGILFNNTSSSRIFGTNTTGSYVAGIYLEYSNKNTLSNLTSSSNTPYGLGISFTLDSSFNNLTNSTVASNSFAGIFLNNSTSNRIYNNIFNNTNNFAAAMLSMLSGPRNGGAFSNDFAVGTMSWQSPTNAQSSDGTSATASLCELIGGGASPAIKATAYFQKGCETTSRYLTAQSFGFSIPTNARIDGILVTIRKAASVAGTVSDNSIRIINRTNFLATEYAAGGVWGTTLAYSSYGGPRNTWGATWSAADINHAGFGVAISAVNPTTISSTASIDHVNITVYYTLPTPVEITIPVNIWNRTKVSGKNIMNGSYLGGNFWANPSGTGFSQTCSDTNPWDSICDSTYTIEASNTDSLPLTTEFSLPTVLNSTIRNLTNGTLFYKASTLVGFANGTSGLTPFNYSYKWFKNGALNLSGTFAGASSGVEYNIANITSGNLSKGQTWRLEITGMSASGNSSPLNSTQINISNTPPTTSTPTLSPANALRFTPNITCVNGSSSDIDGDDIQFYYLWFKNNVSTGITTEYITNSSFTTYDNITCQITPYNRDENEIGAPANSSSLTISLSGAVPTVIHSRIRNTSLSSTGGTTFYKNSTLFGLANATSEAVPFNYSYKWFKNGELNLSGTFDGASSGVEYNIANITSGNLSKGQNWTLEITAVSSSGNSTSNNSSTISISNSLPITSNPTFNPSIAYANTDNVSCENSTTSDIDSDTTSFYYLWFKNGTSTGLTTQAITSLSYGASDVLVCQITPFDGTSNGTSRNSSQLTILISSPDILYSRIFNSSASAGNGTQFYKISTLFGLANATFGGGSFNYSYKWFKNGALNLTGTYVGASSATETNIANITSGNLSKGQNWTLEITAVSSSGNSTSNNSSVITISNLPPNTSTPALSPTVAYTNTSNITCSNSSASDEDGDSVSFSYLWFKNGAATGVATSYITNSSYVANDNITCQITPSDGFDNGTPVNSSQTTITATPPSSPSVRIINSTNGTQFYKISTLFGLANATFGGGSFNYSYKWFKNGELNLSGTFDGASSGVEYNIANITSDNLSKGQNWTLEITAVSSSGNSSAVNSTSINISNSPPNTSLPTVSPSIVYTNTANVSCNNSTSADNDGDSISFFYLWFINGSSTGITSSNISNSSFGAGDSVLCQITPSDGAANGSSSNSTSLTILFPAPTINSITIINSSNLSENGTVFYATSTLFGFANASHASSSFNFSYRWFVNGVLNLSGVFAGAASGISSNIANITSDNLSKGQNWTLEITAVSSSGNSSAANSSSVSISNSRPTTSAPTLSPTAVNTNTSIVTCNNGTTLDADWDTVSFYYLWYKNNASTGNTSSSLSNSSFTANDILICQITPFDGTENGTPANSTHVTVGVQEPTIVSVFLYNSTNASENGTVYFNNYTIYGFANSSYSGNSSFNYTYSWYVDGAVNSTGNFIGATEGMANIANLSGVLSKNQRWVLEVVAVNNLYSTSPKNSTTAIIWNTPPTTSSPALSPTTITKNTSAVYCLNGSTSDADGDNVSFIYLWYRNGNSTGVTAQFITNSSFNLSDNITCQIMAIDLSADTKAARNLSNISSSSIAWSNPANAQHADSSYASVTLDSERSTSLAATNFSFSLAPWSNVTGVLVSVAKTTGEGVAQALFDDSVKLIRLGTVSGSNKGSSESWPSSPAAIYYGGSYDLWNLNFTPSGINSGNFGVAISAVSHDYAQALVDSINITVYSTTNSSKYNSSTVQVTNAPPVTGVPTLVPSVAYTNTKNITCINTSAYDYEGSNISFYYLWFKNGAATAFNNSSISNSSFTENDALLCQITPFDGTYNGTPVNSSQLTVYSININVTIASILNTSNGTVFMPDSVLYGHAKAVAPLNPSSSFLFNYSYTWYLNGAAVEAGSYPNAQSNADTVIATMGDLVSGQVWILQVTAIYNSSRSTLNSSPIKISTPTVSCSNLSTANALYTLASGLNVASGTCLNVIAQNVTVDCQGQSIDGGLNSDTIGIHINRYNNTVVKNCTLRNLGYGLYLSTTSGGLVTNNTIANSTETGIYLNLASGNTFYNNYIRNYENYNNPSGYSNVWNTNPGTSTNIVAGRKIGGNFWADPLGSGFSEICEDYDNNSICDSPLALDSSNKDFYPLGVSASLPGSCDNMTESGVYTLTGSISGYPVTCMKVLANFVTLDCLGRTIDGLDGGGTYGISVIGYNNTTIKNCVVTDFYDGVHIENSHSNRLINVTTNSNTNTGLSLISSGGNVVDALASRENRYYDLLVQPSSPSDCANTIENSTGSGERQILYAGGKPGYLYNDVASQIVFCNAVSSFVENVTVSGSDTLENNGIFAYYSNYSTFANVDSSDNLIGLELSKGSSYATVIGSKFTSNSRGVSIDGGYNELANLTLDYNKYGLYMVNGAHDNTLTNSIVKNNDYGFYLYSAVKNTFFNNYFSNAVNVEVQANQKNIWNTTKIPGANIIGGSNLGGNYWAKEGADGFSQLCADANDDSICDTGYKVNSNNNIDMLPLAGINRITECMQITKSGAYLVAADVAGSGKCINVLANNVDITCEGNTISGTNQSSSIGVNVQDADNFRLSGCTISNFGTGLKISQSSGSSITGTKILSSKLYGINLTGVHGSKIYNNLFNNARNAFVQDSSNISWNRAKFPAISIVGGSYSGGNAWASPTGVDFSQLCYDSQPDGICDQQYNVSGNFSPGSQSVQAHIDYLPLSIPSGDSAGVNFITISSDTSAQVNLSFQDIRPGEEKEFKFMLRNDGIQNIALGVYSDKDAGEFIGGSNPLFQISAQSYKPGSCFGSLAGFSNLSAKAVELCPSLQFRDESDTLEITVKVKIDTDSPAQESSAYLTFVSSPI